jgi:folate-binding protein YgfZ
MTLDPLRAPLCVSGEDRLTFLQGLLTQDIKPQDLPTYGAILTPQGRVLHDALIFYSPEAVLLFVEKNRRHDALTLLNRYRLRAKVTLSADPLVLLRGQQVSEATPFPDPRHPALGWVGYGPAISDNNEDLTWYHQARFLEKIPDGSLDMPPGEALPLDYGLDRCHGIAWDKGCYMGQEVTARMHYRALIKNELVSVCLTHPETESALPPPFSDLRDYEGRSQGIMASSQGAGQGALGLALVKKDTSWPLSANNIPITQKHTPS